LGDYRGAKRGYEKCLEINRRVFGEEDINYINNLESLSIVNRNLGDYLVAKEGLI
jgi:hypothetical protein